MKRRMKRGTRKSFKRAHVVETSRCDVLARAVAGGTIRSNPPLNGAAARIVQTINKPPPARAVESAVAAWHKSRTELSALAKLLADKSARQAALEISGDLHDAAVLAELGRLQIFTGLLPRRIAAKEEADAKAEQALTETTNQFIREHLGPRVRRLADRTRAMVERELSAHFRDAAALIVAVSKSERVRSIAGLDWSVSVNPPRGALEHAQGALNSWQAADKFENHVQK